jgi:hypothetical protein
MLFYTVCIPSRLIYAYIQNTYSYFWWVNIVIAAYFLYAFITVREGVITKVPWWNYMRLIHSIMFSLAVYYPVVLYVDVILGIMAKLHHDYK